MTKSLRKNVPDPGLNPWMSSYQADMHPTELAGLFFSHTKAFIRNKIWPLRKKVEGQLGLGFIIWTNLVVFECCIPSFNDLGHSVLKKRIFKGSYHIWAWQLSWSCDQDQLNILLFREVPPSHRRSIWNLTLVCLVVSEEKMFKGC